MTLTELQVFAALFATAGLLGFGQQASRKHWLLALPLLAFILSMIAVVSVRSVMLPVAFVALPVFVIFCARYGLWKQQPPKRRPVSAAALAIATLAVMLPPAMFTADVEFPDLEGPHPVGVRAAEVSDPERGNGWDGVSDGPRRFLLRVWYPAATIPEGAENHRNTVYERRNARVLGQQGIDPFQLFSEALAKTETNAFWDAPVAEGQFPLLIYSHGYGGNVSVNAMLMEQLASHGFIVVSLSHPGESHDLVYLDGEVMPRSPRANAVRNEGIAVLDIWDQDIDARMAWVRDELSQMLFIKERMPLWALDFQSVVEALEDQYLSDSATEIVGAMDFGAIGFLGMSGGAASAPAACHVNTRCDAAVALDVLGGLNSMRDTPIRTPLLVFESQFPHGVMGQYLFYERHSEYGLNPDIHRIVFPLNGHSDFTDRAFALTGFGKWLLNYLPPVLLGPVDAQETTLTQSRLVTGFFEIYLKGAEPAGFPGAILDETDIAEPIDPAPFRDWVHRQRVSQ